MILVAVDVQPVARGKLPDDLLPRPSPQTETELGQTAASSVRHAHSCSFGGWQGERAQTGRSTPRESPQNLRPAGTEKTGIPGVSVNFGLSVLSIMISLRFVLIWAVMLAQMPSRIHPRTRSVLANMVRLGARHAI